MSEKPLDVPQDEPFQKAEWTIQRVGWVLWGLIVLAALAGLLGTGPLSHADSSASDESLIVRYDRFVHYHKPTAMEVLVKSHRGEPLQLKLARSFLDRIQMLRIEPEPEEQSLAEDGVVYAFTQDGSPELSKVLFHFEYEKFGTTKGSVELVGGGSASFQQFVYP